MIREKILKNDRQYYIEKVQSPLLKAAIVLGMRYPEPAGDNVSHPNAKVWLRVFAKFLNSEDNPGRLPLWQAIKRVFIGKFVEVDPYYRDRLQVIHELWLEEVLSGNWKPRSMDYPQDCWRNPNERGDGYKFLMKCFYYPEWREKLQKLLEAN